MASKLKIFLGLGLVAVLLVPALGLAQDEGEVTGAYAPQSYLRAQVIEILEDQPLTESGLSEAEQVVVVKLLAGDNKGEQVTITYTFAADNYEHQKLKVGDRVVVAQVSDARGDNYYLLDSYRLSTVLIFVFIFAVVAVVLGRRQGFGSILGLGVSLAVLMLFIVPRIIAGSDPLLIGFVGALIIAVVSILLAHGFKQRTYLALGATVTTLGVALGLAVVVAALANLSGTGTEEAVYLQFSYLPGLNLRGLFLAGVMIGALGVLDDVTTAQAAAVEEISLANPTLGVGDLYARGLSVGREHIAALVNTLVLAYAGAAFPLFMLFVLPDHPPIWVILNSENIVEEILRALVGGLALILSVPITTALAAATFGRLKHR